MENSYRMNIVSLEMDRDEDASVAESTLSNLLESSRVGADLKLDECGGWTNEKHNTYLNNLEKSFVRQLYSLLGGETQRLSRTRDLQPNSHKSSDQVRGLFFRNLDRNYTMGTTKQGDVLCNEETKHSGDKAFTRTSMRNSVGNEYQAQSTAESSGQNFIEEEGKGWDSEVTVKRKSDANDDDSLVKYQVVPVRMVKPRV